MDASVSDKLPTIVSMIDAFVDRERIPIEPLFLSGQGRHRQGARDFRRQAEFKKRCVNDQ